MLCKMLLYPMPKTLSTKTTRACHKYHVVVYYPSCSWEEHHCVIYFISVFLRLVTFSCVFFFEALASAPSARRVFVVGFWVAPESASRGPQHWSMRILQAEIEFLVFAAEGNSDLQTSIKMENADWKWITDSQFFLYCKREYDAEINASWWY